MEKKYKAAQNGNTQSKSASRSLMLVFQKCIVSIPANNQFFFKYLETLKIWVQFCSKKSSLNDAIKIWIEFCTVKKINQNLVIQVTRKIQFPWTPLYMTYLNAPGALLLAAVLSVFRLLASSASLSPGNKQQWAEISGFKPLIFN